MFERLRRKKRIDLLELGGNDLRGEPFEVRKATLGSLLRGCQPGLRLTEHLSHPGDLVFCHACKMGLEGIVSKRLGSRYRSGRTKDWLKFKNPDAPARQAGGRGGLGQGAVMRVSAQNFTYEWRIHAIFQTEDSTAIEQSGA